jgi:hypothetical protein
MLKNAIFGVLLPIPHILGINAERLRDTTKNKIKLRTQAVSKSTRSTKAGISARRLSGV